MTRIEIGRSRYLLGYLVSVHIIMLATLLSLLSMTWWSLLAIILLSVSFIYHARQSLWLKSKKSVAAVERNAEQKWTICYQDNSKKSDLTLSCSYVTPKLVMLYFNGSCFWQSDTVTMMADAVDAELFRQLRVYLRAPKTFQQ